LPLWSVFGEGHFTSLAGKSFDFSDLGVFALSISPDGNFKVSSRQVACQFSSASCSQAVSIFILGRTIVITAPQLSSGTATLTIDGVPAPAYAPLEMPSGSGYFLRQTSVTNLEVDGVDSLVLKVVVSGRFLNINCQVSRDYCAASSGVMGTCDPTDAPTKLVPDYTGNYATCSVYGHAHYQTFDQTSFTFPGSCTYTMAQVAGRNQTYGFNVVVNQVACLGTAYCSAMSPFRFLASTT
jgi:hypothetical protein